MADDAEDPETAADRLEAALERIARLAAGRPMTAAAMPSPQPPSVAAAGVVDGSDADLSLPQIADRLDSLIARLRAALGEPKTQ
ncbi:hypothetical protein [Rhodopila sp.]|jgi:hypothetical protein|uniref:hypothetical protein n=1 Tax=Rhodopila sp. TaxID=2480087 RepID=UPI002CCC5592|nr:hypothetical protein [Rhodopila sp.]HVZ08525.1 hypothetical protein [Rhodopila sp.]